jgi:hypothetical protein
METTVAQLVAGDVIALPNRGGISTPVLAVATTKTGRITLTLDYGFGRATKFSFAPTTLVKRV